ncbi:MAG: hypothetical protein KZQ93_13665 [Candidatus Thiodiazotropha sp. (ex Monitilora ramsayi)]|nr:hypothetical protein [Candidatus Thiodiazotropha sp. (ex Monitilora ramsayi)]
MKPKINTFLLLSAISILTIAGSLPVVAQDNDSPCSLASFAEVADWTGITVANTLPQGNLRVLASCTFGGVVRPPVLSYAVTRGAAARDGYVSNQMWPDFTAVTGIGQEAMWIPSRRMLAVLVRNDLYLLVRIEERSVGGDGQLGLAQQIATVLINRL